MRINNTGRHASNESPRHASLVLLPVMAGAVLVLLSGAPAAFAQHRVGVTSAVNPDATGTPPGAPIHRLVIGQEVVFNERITTDQAGQTQLLFLDASAMTIGPNSDLTIDQFVYDPKSGTGKLAMSAARGLLRFVGGKLSKQDEGVVLRTNSASLTVRGGVFLLNQAPNGSLEAVFIYGRDLTVTGTTGASETLLRPGYAVTVAGPGAAPSRPFPVPPSDLAEFLAQLDGRSGGNGGASVVPTDQMAASSGIAQTTAVNPTVTMQQMGYTLMLPSQQLIHQQVQTTANGFTPAVNPTGTGPGTTATNPVQIGTAASGQPVGGSNINAINTSILGSISSNRSTALPATTTMSAPSSVSSNISTAPFLPTFPRPYPRRHRSPSR